MRARLIVRGKTENIQHFEDCAIKLSFGNEKVAKDNCNKLCDLGQPIIQINALYSSRKAKHINGKEFFFVSPIHSHLDV